MEASLSPLVGELDGAGSIRTRRLDLRLRVPGLPAPLHVVTWGEASAAAGGALDMMLCIPDDALESILGTAAVPEGCGLAVPVRGTAAAPVPDLGAATRTAAALLLRSKAAQAAETRLGVPRWMAEEMQAAIGVDSAVVRMPPPTE